MDDGENWGMERRLYDKDDSCAAQREKVQV
jgi:hypothetical protein